MMSTEIFMNIKEIQRRVAEIKECAAADDDEAAHAREDRLYEDFIVYISKNGSDEVKAMATEILKTADIKFSRWYA